MAERFQQKHNTAALAAKLYVNQQFSLTRIARTLGCAQRTVSMMLDKVGVPRRTYTSTRVCWCGSEAEKRVTKGKRKHETFYGRLCRAHRLERNNQLQRARRTARQANAKQTGN